MYFQDESRFGLFTKNGKALTAKGVKPICPFQQVFQSTYIYGAFSPINGNHFMLELPRCNSENFQAFLNEFSIEIPNELKIVVLDNGAFHKASTLQIPKNIVLIFLPPYSPELNPAEKIWQHIKRAFTNRLYSNLEQLSQFITEASNNITPEIVMKTCRFQYIFLDPFWTNI